MIQRSIAACIVVVCFGFLAAPAEAQKKSKRDRDLGIGTFSLSGKIVEASDMPSTYVFKSGGKKVKILISSKVGLVTHEVKKLTDLPTGTPLTIFAKRILWDTGVYQMESVSVIVAGDYSKPLFLETDYKKPRWYSGKLSFQAKKNRVYIDNDMMHIGKGRKVIVANRGKLGDIEGYIGKKLIVRGMYVKDKDTDKAQIVMVSDIIIPTKGRGVSAKEYKLILFPENLKPSKPLGS